MPTTTFYIMDILNIENVELTKTQKITIEIDTRIWTKKRLKQFAKEFLKKKKMTIEELKLDIIAQIQNQALLKFYRGYRHIKTCENGEERPQYDPDWNRVTNYCEGIKIYIRKETKQFKFN